MEQVPLLFRSGRALIGAGDDPVVTNELLLFEEVGFGMRRSGPAEAERVEVLFTGWKIAPSRRKTTAWLLFRSSFSRKQK